jgi:HlyD family secretion protein
MVLSIQKQQLDIEMAQEDIASLNTGNEIDPITAPIDGILATFDVHAGDAINPNGDLGEIVNYAQLQMVVGIDELDIPKVKRDQEAEILVEALPEETYAGKVISIADEGTTSNGVASFDVTIQLTDANNLKVGMSAEASIMTEKKTDALYVPIEAVQSSQGKYYVMVPSTGTGTATRTEQAPQVNQNDPAAQADPTAQAGLAGQAPSDRAGSFQNMTDEERAAMREQFMAARGNGTANQRGAGTTSNNIASTTRVQVEIGINNEDNIEIISGLKEGDSVVLPTVVSSSTNSNAQTGFPGMGGGGIPGAGGGFPGGGGFTGGNTGGGRQTTGGAAGGAR